MSEVVLEKSMNGKSVDVALRTADGVQAFEIQLSSSVRPDLLREMIQKDLAAGFTKIFICVESSRDVLAVNRVISEMEDLPDLFGKKPNIRERVQPKLLADFL